MGAHSAGRRVRAPGRFRRLNLAAEYLFITALVGAAGYAGWVSFEPPPTPGPDPTAPAEPSEPTDPPVAAFTPTTARPTATDRAAPKDADLDGNDADATTTRTRTEPGGSGSCS